MNNDPIQWCIYASPGLNELNTFYDIGIELKLNWNVAMTYDALYDIIQHIQMGWICNYITILINTDSFKSIVTPNTINFGSGNGLSPIRRQATTWTNAELLSIGHL